MAYYDQSSIPYGLEEEIPDENTSRVVVTVSARWPDFLRNTFNRETTSLFLGAHWKMYELRVWAIRLESLQGEM